MDALDLPLLNETDSLDHAIKQLQLGDRHAIAVRRESGIELLLNTDIVEAAAQGLRTFANVPELAERVVREDIGDPSARELIARALKDTYSPGTLTRRGAIPGIDQQQAMELLATGDFAVVELVEGWVRVLTRHEGFAARLDPQPVWVCSKNRGHQPPTPPVQAGAACDYCDGVYQAI